MGTQPNVLTIVVATDFSENANVAISWAQEFARLRPARIVLAHAFRREPSVAPPFIPVPQKRDADIRGDAKARLDHQAESARRSGARVDCELGLGPPVEVVIATAERHRADLIVAGTRGRKGLKNLLLGSTATGLVRTAPCPVLTVHPTGTHPKRPMRTVLVPTDLSEDAVVAANAATRILRFSGLDQRIVLLHALRVPYEATYLPAQPLTEALSTANLEANQRISALAARLRHTGVAVDTRICETDLTEAILAHAETLGADLIAMCTQRLSDFERLLAGSIAERVVASAVCPVLTIRPSSA
jgi:nucleotide-binding universal stress UspA family protein